MLNCDTKQSVVFDQYGCHPGKNLVTHGPLTVPMAQAQRDAKHRITRIARPREVLPQHRIAVAMLSDSPYQSMLADTTHAISGYVR
ncbi:hypothetical protein KYC_27097 [Achromobacter arsenitoxydans SY8]|uniref:Uncharacterized protein n=1 Tax=Achromobacter arsenitoxydans SY8 TaxID=477184 RepID=H0FF53_9BURK|nr:hypothetical protein KYC_27097 [Achromobacter arsenitoxydans SY8]